MIKEQYNNLTKCHICSNEYELGSFVRCSSCDYEITCVPPYIQIYKVFDISPIIITINLTTNISSVLLTKRMNKIFIKPRKSIKEYIDLYIKYIILI